MQMYRQRELLGLRAMNAFRIEPRRTALVVVDMQYGATHRDFGFKKLYRQLGMVSEVEYEETRLRTTVIPNIRRLLDAFHEAATPVIYLTIGSERDDYGDLGPRRLARIAFWKAQDITVPYSRVGDPGHAIISELQPNDGDIVINKTTASAFNSSSFETVLRQHDITTLVVCGVGTSYCVEMTFRDASDRGYLCILAENACGAGTRELHERAVDTMAFYGRVEDAGAVINELTRAASEGASGAPHVPREETGVGRR